MKYIKKAIRILRVFMATRKERKKKKNLPLIAKWSSPSIPPAENKGTRITWIGHSTFLIQIDSVNIITDPIFFDLPMGLKRLLPPGIPLNHLPKIDVVLISHNHRDHMDKRSLIRLKEDNPFILVPNGNKQWFEKRNFYNVHEYQWGESEKLSLKKTTISISFLPAEHWSCRTPFDLNYSGWGSWMIEHKSKKIYFAGDSGASPIFEKIGNQFKDIDVALMPLGPIEPRNLMKASHMSPQESIDAFISLKAKQFIPMHWGTYQTGCDEFEAPILQLTQAWKERSKELNSKKLHIIKCGEQVEPFIEFKAKSFEQQSIPAQKQL